MEIKFIILALLLLLFIGAWWFSKSKLQNKLKMNEQLFMAANSILLFCSLGGLIVTFLIGETIITSHAFEIILIPALIAFVITGVSKNPDGSKEHYDEKQKSNMKDAATFSWMLVILTSFVLYALYSAGNVYGIIFFPIILFVAFASYAGSLIYFFKMD